MCAHHVQPGVASVYCSIVQQTRNGVECYVRDFPQLQGLPFREVPPLQRSASSLHSTPVLHHSLRH